MKTYQLIDYDVWGNDDDGYTVNQSFRTDTWIDIDNSWDDARLVKELKKAGIIRKGIRTKSVEFGGDDMTIYVDYKGMPQFELRIEA
jgi:hypothetical protein